MDGSRRLSQALAEGDGISVIARVAHADAARAAQEEGAEAIAVAAELPGLRDATSLPVLWLGRQPAANADASVLVVADAADELEARHDAIVDRGLECVVDVSNEEELERALERLEPEIFLISPREAEEDDEPLDRVLDLLPDVPAGKLAIAEVPSADREAVIALERAGFDAVLVGHHHVADLVGAEPPRV